MEGWKGGKVQLKDELRKLGCKKLIYEEKRGSLRGHAKVTIQQIQRESPVEGPRLMTTPAESMKLCVNDRPITEEEEEEEEDSTKFLAFIIAHYQEHSTLENHYYY
ncbi:hypothetical protein O3M35_012087 [Rhynocoris fuscipes]|uniref:Uncharacterized protein n=1 Tax=Rhynocoris fuscipes TaxID=488301 RepID=A0AAW1CR44_9HEMI